ncbi:hypothetical protein LX36DRAFT_232911 [Colletotrichum falcatum]|nr:hypothetical protein LX36DRAFT_232911 [Colletotrichum falcatum]
MGRGSASANGSRVTRGCPFRPSGRKHEENKNKKMKNKKKAVVKTGGHGFDAGVTHLDSTSMPSDADARRRRRRNATNASQTPVASLSGGDDFGSLRACALVVMDAGRGVDGLRSGPGSGPGSGPRPPQQCRLPRLLGMPTQVVCVGDVRILRMGKEKKKVSGGRQGPRRSASDAGTRMRIGSRRPVEEAGSGMLRHTSVFRDITRGIGIFVCTGVLVASTRSRARGICCDAMRCDAMGAAESRVPTTVFSPSFSPQSPFSSPLVGCRG